MKKNFKNSIVSLLVIISMMAMPLLPFLNAKKANAQSANAQSATTATVTGMISGLATTILVMPGCKALRTKIKDLFKSDKKTPCFPRKASFSSSQSGA